MTRKLLQLLADNKGARGRVARIEQKAREATLYLYDTLVSDALTAEWWGGVCAQSLVPEIDAIDADVIHVRINSPGGDVFAAQAIAAALERNKARTVAHVDGLAASAATAVAVACDEVLMAAGAMFMIHNAWTISMGDKNDFLETAALLEKVDGNLAARYAKATGRKSAEIVDAMNAETWFTAEEAVTFGFAKAVEESDQSAQASSAALAWNLTALGRNPAPPAAESAKADAPTHEDFERRARLGVLSRRSA